MANSPRDHSWVGGHPKDDGINYLEQQMEENNHNNEKGNPYKLKRLKYDG